MNEQQVFDLVSSELEKVLNVSIFYDKPGLRTALAVVKNTREMVAKNDSTSRYLHALQKSWLQMHKMP